MKRLLPFALAILSYTIASIGYSQITTVDVYNVTCDSLGGATVHVANEVLTNTTNYGPNTVITASSPGEYLILPSPSVTNAVSFYTSAYNGNGTDNTLQVILFDGVGNIVFLNSYLIHPGEYLYVTETFPAYLTEIAGATYFATNGSFQLIDVFFTSSNYTYTFSPNLPNNPYQSNLPANSYSVTATNLAAGMVYNGNFTIMEDYADVDNDGANCTIDCDDNNALYSPLNDELCDGYDNNCNGQVDENLANVNLYGDNDQDGYGYGPLVSVGCVGMNPYLATNDLDCDDANAQVNPSMTEVMNNTIDDDCNPNTPDYIGVEEQLNIVFELYPNPASTLVTLQFNQILNSEYVKVYNLVGSLKHSQAIYSTRTTLDLSDLAAGIYLVKYGNFTARLTVE